MQKVHFGHFGHIHFGHILVTFGNLSNNFETIESRRGNYVMAL